MRLVMLAALAVPLLGGCGKGQPTLAGGKPVSYWIEALTNPDPSLRRLAAFKLGNVGPTDPAVLPALTVLLRDSDARVRCEAILALLKCGPAAKEAVPAFTEIHQHDRDARARSYAARALAKLRDDH